MWMALIIEQIVPGGAVVDVERMQQSPYAAFLVIALSTYTIYHGTQLS